MKKTIVYTLLIIASLFWGVSFIASRELFATEQVLTTPMLITMRLLVASVTSAIVLIPLRRWERIKAGDLKWFMILAACEPFIYSLCETGSLRYVDASLAAVIVALVPVIVPLCMSVIFKQKIQPRLISGLVISFLGVVLITINSVEFRASYQGLLLLFGAIAVSVVYMAVVQKIVYKYSPITITAYQNLFGLIYFIPLVLFTDAGIFTMLSFSPKMIILIAVLGIFCSTLAYVFYNYGIREIGVNQAVAFINAIPVFSFIVAILIGQEKFSWINLVGLTAAIVGLYYAQSRYQHRTSLQHHN